MEKLIDGIATLISVILTTACGHYTLKQVAAWSQKMAVEKAAQGLGKLEPATQKNDRREIGLLAAKSENVCKHCPPIGRHIFE